MEEENDDEYNRTFGLRMRYQFNQLQSFHCVLGFPPDCMHDLVEGVVAQDLFGVIKIFVEQRKFSLEEYNEQLRSIDL